MGIQGFLPLIKPIISSSNISNFACKRVAIDTYSWIHKALYGYYLNQEITHKEKEFESSEEESEIESNKWIHYCLNYLDLLLSYQIEVILVFDGQELPAKFQTEQLRAINRQKNLKNGLNAIKEGHVSTGRSLVAKSIDVTPRMAAQLIRIVKKYRPVVQCVVAPYEADAQLSFLSRNHLVDLVISEDSDCIPYQCKEVVLLLQFLDSILTYLFNSNFSFYS